jgi:hypothetical protein
VSIGVLALLALEPSTATSATISISPTVDGTVRDGLDSPKDGTPDNVLEGSIVQSLDVPQFEDLGIIEFDIFNLSQSIHRASLILTVFAANGPFPFTVDVFTYAGDGNLSLSDFNLGSFYTSFEYRGKSKTITLDVTPFTNDLIALGEGYAGFNFQFSVPSTIASNGPFIAFNSLEFPPAASLRVR